MRTRTFRAFAIAAAFLSVAGGAAFAASADGVVFMSAGQLRDAVARTEGGLAVQNLPLGSDATAVNVRRDADGEVEVHDKIHDVIVPLAGRGSIIVGGKAEGQRATAANEWRGGKITGAATTYQLAPGDFLWIPAGVPHQMLVEKGGSLSYLALKFNLQNEKPK